MVIQDIKSIPFEEYEGIPAASKHLLDALAVSPLHCWSWFMNPERIKPRETPAKVLGNAIHVSILEPKRFEKEYVQEPEPEEGKHLVLLEDYKKVCKINGLPVSGTKSQLSDRLLGAGYPSERMWDYVYNIATLGKKVLSQHDWRAVKAITNRVRKHNAMAGLLWKGQAEQSIFWVDKETGVQCKGRLDWLTHDNIIVDLKSTTDASPEGFQRSISKYRYYVQAAMYMDGLSQLDPTPLPGAFVFAAWEKTVPYASALYYATNDMLDEGRKEYKRLLRIYADCLSSDKWAGYSEDILPIDLPDNFVAKQDDNIERDWLDDLEDGLR